VASHANRLSRAHPGHVRRAGIGYRAPVGDGMIELFEQEAEGRGVFLFDRAVIETVERFAQRSEGSARPARME
jgi:hypothetical protein